MMKYPKINTIWMRDEKNKFSIIEGAYSCPEFDAIKKWHITEKIDGMNLRVVFDKGKNLEPEFAGRGDNSNIPAPLKDHLKRTFNGEIFLKQFSNSKKVILYGELYGNTIQPVGEQYRDDNSFILFDAWIDGWWLDVTVD